MEFSFEARFRLFREAADRAKTVAVFYQGVAEVRRVDGGWWEVYVDSAIHGERERTWGELIEREQFEVGLEREQYVYEGDPEDDACSYGWQAWSREQG